MVIAHLLASPFVGGPERQVLGLASSLPDEYRSVFLSFPERGLARPFLQAARRQHFEAVELQHNWPRALRAVHEVAHHLRRVRANLVCTSGYKPDLIGWWAARQVGIPVVAIAHGWTAATLKVRLNETLDRWVMRHTDCVVAVSDAQARRVLQAGVTPDRVAVIRNAIEVDDSAPRDSQLRDELLARFPVRPRHLVMAAGRLSREKGFDVLVKAMADSRFDSGVGIILFGDGPELSNLSAQRKRHGLEDRFVLAGFHDDLRRLLPQGDLFVLPSRREGLPVVLLEAMLAGLPVVATDVGGVAEVVQHERDGVIVSPDRPQAIADAVDRLIKDKHLRLAVAESGRDHVQRNFSTEVQSQQFQRLFDALGAARRESIPA